MLELDKAYRKVQRTAEQLGNLAEVLGPQFGEYSNPFKDVAYRLNHAMMDLRKSLIEKAAESYRCRYMPNAKPDVDFKKLMDEKAGEDRFRESVISRWFLKVASDRKNLRAQSLKELQDKASRLVPYGYHMEKGREVWGKPRSVKELVKGRVLRVKVYTWDSGKYGGLRTYHHTEQVLALEKLIAVATERKNPTYVKGDTVGIHNHLWHERDPVEFYKKQEVSHKAVKSFRFFKNGTLTIEFKTERDARKVAKLLLA